MALGVYDWIYGVAQFSAAFLSLIAIVISAFLIVRSLRDMRLLPWRFLLVGVMLFAVEEILGALIAFGIILPTFWTHVIPSLIMIFLIVALVSQLWLLDRQRIREHHEMVWEGRPRSSSSKRRRKKQ